ncbi:hypothetical protein BDA96_02G088000 [Sorghum bicolor]|uniref:Uncharacterized protein n=2 Tax=Sorghum bicolor TaxID=4558 RepID=A0A921Q558_SORBI|nr:hypothetical protein BDA96_10G275500 [Sorghum bicolor]KAG0542264.1 hypothetical protein BDA96_02G088000 [Sorghum bicolor]KXG34743.1 hypothetical protein SORBI_3002G084600 [Sorghum bicolor]
MEQSAPPPLGPRAASTLSGAVSASSRALLSQADAAALVDVHGITDGSSTRSELESESNQMKTPASDRNSSNREKNPGFES